MSRDKLKLYILEFILTIFLFFTLFVSNIYRTLILAIFLLIYTPILKIAIKKRNITSYQKKEIIILMTIFAIIYVIGFYLLGIYFGFYKATVTFGLTSLIYFIIPLTIIITATETIREILLSQKGKLTKVITFIVVIVIDLIIYTEVYSIKSLEDFLMVVGYILFASVSCNLLYNYITIRYGKTGIIVYRLITILYAYIIPIIPNVYIFFRSFLRILYPYFIYLFLESTYSKTSFVVAYKDRTKEIISTSVLVLTLSLIIMLVSCQFKYGILVIGSGSMKGTLNYGDATIYEKYDNQTLKKGDVIVFNKDKLQIIHRINDIKEVNGKVRYYTKGDANDQIDDGYITDKEIKGITKLRIKHIGYPTLWIKEIFS